MTSFGECVLSRDDSTLPIRCFRRCSFETEIGPKGDTIYATRNKRSPSDPDIVIAHLVADSSQDGRETQAETDRRAFIGRGRDITDPAAFDPGARLGGHDGYTMDPVFSLRRTLRVPAGKEVSITFWTIAAPDREGLDRAVMHYRRAETFIHETTLAWTRSQVQIRHIDMTPEEAANFQKFANFMIYPDIRLRPKEAIVREGLRPQSSLWPMSISGDYPIFSLRIDGEAEIAVGTRSAAHAGISALARRDLRPRHHQRAVGVLRAGPQQRDQRAVRERQPARARLGAWTAHLLRPQGPDGRGKLGCAHRCLEGCPAHPQRQAGRAARPAGEG